MEEGQKESYRTECNYHCVEYNPAHFPRMFEPPVPAVPAALIAVGTAIASDMIEVVVISRQQSWRQRTKAPALFFANMPTPPAPGHDSNIGMESNSATNDAWRGEAAVVVGAVESCGRSEEDLQVAARCRGGEVGDTVRTTSSACLHATIYFRVGGGSA